MYEATIRVWHNEVEFLKQQTMWLCSQSMQWGEKCKAGMIKRLGLQETTSLLQQCDHSLGDFLQEGFLSSLFRYQDILYCSLYNKWRMHIYKNGLAFPKANAMKCNLHAAGDIRITSGVARNFQQGGQSEGAKRGREILKMCVSKWHILHIKCHG